MRLEILDSMGDGPDNHVYSQNLVELPNQDKAIGEIVNDVKVLTLLLSTHITPCRYQPSVK